MTHVMLHGQHGPYAKSSNQEQVSIQGHRYTKTRGAYAHCLLYASSAFRPGQASGIRSESMVISIHSIQVKLQGSGQGPRFSDQDPRFQVKHQGSDQGQRVQVEVHGFQYPFHPGKASMFRSPRYVSAIQVKCQGPDFPAMAIDVRRQGCDLPVKCSVIQVNQQDSDLPSMVIAIDVRRQGSDFPAMCSVIQVKHHGSDRPSMVIAIRGKHQGPDHPSMPPAIQIKRQGPDHPSMFIVIQIKHQGFDRQPMVISYSAIHVKRQGSDRPSMVIIVQVKHQGSGLPAMSPAIQIKHQDSDLPAMAIQVKHQDSDLPAMGIGITKIDEQSHSALFISSVESTKIMLHGSGFKVYMTIVFTLQAKQQGSKLKFGLQFKPAIMDPISVQCYSVLAVKGNEQEPVPLLSMPIIPNPSPIQSDRATIKDPISIQYDSVFTAQVEEQGFLLHPRLQFGNLFTIEANTQDSIVHAGLQSRLLIEIPLLIWVNADDQVSTIRRVHTKVQEFSLHPGSQTFKSRDKFPTLNHEPQYFKSESNDQASAFREGPLIKSLVIIKFPLNIIGVLVNDQDPAINSTS
ncbi:hypothetical protein F4703DRAFT_1933453 [Phycomyces blakesleeanus]